MTHHGIFDSLARNAFDFRERGIAEFDKSPKRPARGRRRAAEAVCGRGRAYEYLPPVPIFFRPPPKNPDNRARRPATPKMLTPLPAKSGKHVHPARKILHDLPAHRQ